MCSSSWSRWPPPVPPPACQCFSWDGEPKGRLITPDAISQVLEGYNHVLCKGTFLTHSICCWAQVFFRKATSQPVLPSLVQDFAFTFGGLHDLSVGPFLQLVHSGHPGWHPLYSSVSAAAPSLVSSASLSRVRASSSLKLLTKLLNSTDCVIEPWETPLVVGCQLDFALLILWIEFAPHFVIHLCPIPSPYCLGWQSTPFKSELFLQAGSLSMDRILGYPQAKVISLKVWYLVTLSLVTI